MHQSAGALILLVILIPACASKRTVPSVIDDATQVAKTPPDQITTSHHSSWTLTPVSTTHKYHSVTNTRIQLDGLDTGKAEDTISTITEFTISLDQLQTSVAVEGQINQILINAGVRVGLSPQQFISPIGFSGTLTHGKLILRSSSIPPLDENSCNTMANIALGDIRTALATVPSKISVTSHWTDTISASICAGSKIRSNLEIVRSYSVIGETNYAGISALLLKRAEVTHLSGTGSQNQHQIKLEVFGSGLSDLYIDTISGLVLTVESHNDSRLRMNASGQTHYFSQTINQRITLSP